MKTTITTFILTCTFACLCFAQNGINYKAVIKDGSGNIIANELIDIDFRIVETSAAGLIVYHERHAPSTDDNGIIIVNIGEGVPLVGTYANIDWADDLHFLNVQVDTGSGFVNLGTTEFKAVPYALTADKIELPYYDETIQSGAAFHVQNDFSNGRYGVAGTAGPGSEILPPNNAGVFGQGSGAHGVYGVSKTSFFAGVQGVSESPTGSGVLGYGFGGGVGGHFYTTSSGQAALITGTGNVGIGIDEPEEKLHVAGNMLLQTNLGSLILGFPNNGNQWYLNTIGGGDNLQFRSKPDGSNTLTTRFKMYQGGEFQMGTTATPTAWMHVRNNSTVNKQHILMEEVGNDYARIGFKNTSSSGNWDIAGLPSNTTANARLNFYFRNASGGANRMTINGDGQVGINGTATARLELFQQSQSVGTGLRFDDGTANSDWDITHGFGLRFHYGGVLKGVISATTGAYIQSSDVRLKSNVQGLNTVLSRVDQLRPTTYSYISDESSKQSIGLIAQEVQKIFPEVVHYTEADDLYGIDYGTFSVIAIKAIQEQQTIIEKMEKRLAALEQKIGN